MKRFHMRIRLTRTGKRAVACGAAGIVVLALLLFFVLFKVDRVEVIGSTKYTDKEVKEYAMKSPLTANTVLASLFKSHMEAENIPFVESFDLEQLDRHSLRIHVNEKKIVGYVVQGTDKLYFDKDGKIVESAPMEEEEIARMEAGTEELEMLKAEAERKEAEERAKEAEKALSGNSDEKEDSEEENPEKDTIPQPVETLTAEEVDYGNEGATKFHAAVTDVPMVVGLTNQEVQLGEKIPVEEESVFNTILGITRMVEKYQILPEQVYFDQDRNITLIYNEGSIHCQLGQDTLLEEKLTRVAAILPNLKELTGILHLEDYTADTTNIIFSQETLYSLKSKMAEAERMIQEAEPGGEKEPMGEEPGGEAEPTGEVEPTGEAKPTGETEPAGEAEPTGEAKPTGEAEPTREAGIP